MIHLDFFITSETAICSDSIRSVPLSSVNFKDLIDYDTNIHRIKREAWVKSILDHQPESVAALNGLDQIVGYAGVFSWSDRNCTIVGRQT